MKRSVLAALACVGLAACSGETLLSAVGDQLSDPEAEGEAAAAVDSTELTTIESALLMAASDAIVFGDDTSAIAAAVADAAGTTWTPSDCVQSESVGATASWTFNNCAGPRGFVTVSGLATLVITEASANGASISLTATDLEVNDAIMTINATGSLTAEGEMRVLDMTTSGAGRLGGGGLIGRAGTWNGTFDDSCITLGGQWTTTINNQTFWNTAVTGLKACNGGCPEQGTIVYTGVDNPDAEVDLNARAVTVNFDGDDTANFASTRVAVGTIPLSCTP